MELLFKINRLAKSWINYQSATTTELDEELNKQEAPKEEKTCASLADVEPVEEPMPEKVPEELEEAVLEESND